MLHLWYQSSLSLERPEGCGFVTSCVYKCLSWDCRDVYETESIKNKINLDRVMMMHTHISKIVFLS